MGSAFKLAVCGVFAAGILATFWALPAALGQSSTSAPSPDTEHYRVMQSADSESGRPVRLDVFAASLSGERLELHLGFRNLSEGALDAFGLLTSDDYQLVDDESSRRIETAQVDTSVSVICPLDGLDAGFTNSGSVIFSKPDGPGPFKLRVSGFKPIHFSLDPTQIAEPPAGLESLEISPDIILNSSHEMLAIFALQISRIELRETEISFQISFKNTSNRRFQFHRGSLSGQDAVLLDGDLVRHRPVKVSPEFEESIGPVEHSWAPAEQISGTLTFPRPNPHALRELSFSIKGFNDLLLTYDDASRSYRTKVSSPELQDRHTQNPLVRAGSLHAELTAHLAKISAAINQRDEAKFLAQFAGAAGADPTKGGQQLLSSMADVPVEGVELVLAPGQELAPAGGGMRLPSVSAFMDYSIDGAADGERFRSDTQL